MATFHLSVKAYSRSNGYSATAAAAYRAGIRMLDERTGEAHDFSRRRGVVESVQVMPKGAPAWSRAELWNAAEQSETRKNSCVAREFEMSLPHELSAGDRRNLAVEFTAWLVDRYGFAADASIHEPTGDDGDHRNHHVHVLTTTRQIGPDGMGEKCRILDSATTGSAEVLAVRQRWELMANAALERAGRPERIDHRSHRDRGLDDMPTVHVGRGPGSAARAARNAEVAEVNEAMRKALAERAQEAARIKAAEADDFARAAADRSARLAHVASLKAASAGRRARAIEVLERASRPDPAVLATRLAEVKRARLAAQAQLSGAHLHLAGALPRAQVEAAKGQARALGARLTELKGAIQAAQVERSHLPWWRWFTARALDARVDQLRQEARQIATKARAAEATSSQPVAEDCRAASARLSQRAEALRQEAGHLSQQLEGPGNAPERAQEPAIRPTQADAPARTQDAPERPRPRG